jgi:hypothetical protein
MLLMFFVALGVDQYVINKTTTNLSRNSMNTLFIIFMKYDGALVRPNGITVYSYEPYLVTKVVLGISYSLILS